MSRAIDVHRSRLRQGTPDRNPTRLVLLTTAALAAILLTPITALGAQRSESIYVDGQTFQINTAAAVKIDATDALLANATPFYIIGFPVAPGTEGPITLPSGYQPQNNGLPSPVRYHDHVTTDLHVVLRRVVVMRYTWDYAYSLSFVPITSVDEILAAEAAGKFEIINPGADDPYQIWTTDVLVRPIISAS
jgi:hypothetical protein